MHYLRFQASLISVQSDDDCSAGVRGLDVLNEQKKRWVCGASFNYSSRKNSICVVKLKFLVYLSTEQWPLVAVDCWVVKLFLSYSKMFFNFRRWEMRWRIKDIKIDKMLAGNVFFLSDSMYLCQLWTLFVLSSVHSTTALNI